MKSYIFVIDTEQYSGNFEREMCAYCTGRYGQCEVGREESKIFEDEVGDPYELFDFIIERSDDDNGCMRPVSIWPTPNVEEGQVHYLSVAIFMEKEPTKEQSDLIKNRSIKYAEKHNIHVTGFRLITETTKCEECEI